MKKLAFQAIENKNSKILILGTMPGEQSLKLQQYYGHRGNQFWKIMFHLLKQPFSLDYHIRTKLLQENNIALWDVLQACEREGSADSKITNEHPNNFPAFYKDHPLVKAVFFGSGKAEELYKKHIGQSTDKAFYRLPSPSGANSWKTFDEKLKDWQIVLQYL